MFDINPSNAAPIWRQIEAVGVPEEMFTIDR